MVKSEQAEPLRILQTQSKERRNFLETVDSEGVNPQLTKGEHQHAEKNATSEMPWKATILTFSSK